VLTRAAASARDWFKDAITYQLHVRTFFDASGDGIGDFPGLIRKLGYLEQLGVTCLWLLPFYESPLRDDGHDIAHFERVHPEYGSLDDFRTFLDEVHSRGLRIITELPINHTSDRHPWFEAARHAPQESRERNFYVWSNSAERYARARVIFSDAQSSNWSWDPAARAFYWHRFFRHQPDLNFDSPHVQSPVLDVMRFWLDLGVDGLSLGAVAQLFERDGTTCEHLANTHAFLKRVRRELDEHYADRVLVAGVSGDADTVSSYFGAGDECHVAFHSLLIPKLFVALIRGEAAGLVDVVQRTSAIPESCQWATSLRNHDALELSALTDADRTCILDGCAIEPQMQVHRGVRRRLAPMLGNQRTRIELAYSLLLSLPGSPVLYYGDEIGMGDDCRLPDRRGLRTPMQWSDDLHGGFSDARAARLATPMIEDPVYGYQVTNVSAQHRDDESLLSRIKRLIHVRRQHRAFGRGSIQFLRTGNPRILAFVRRFDDDAVLIVANVSGTPQPVALDLASAFDARTLTEIVDEVQFPSHGVSPYVLALDGYASYWLQGASPPHADGDVAAHPRRAGTVDQNMIRGYRYFNGMAIARQIAT
jgi:maltose alpha-D-glucosyltransferase/alpha-amylase